MKLFFTFGTLLDFIIINESQLRHAVHMEVIFKRPGRNEQYKYKNVPIKRVTTLKKL